MAINPLMTKELSDAFREARKYEKVSPEYLAGFIDARVSIHVERSSTWPSLAIHATSERPLILAVAAVAIDGATVRIVRTQKSITYRMLMHIHSDIEMLLLQVQPYIRAKRDIVNKALDFLDCQTRLKQLDAKRVPNHYDADIEYEITDLLEQLRVEADGLIELLAVTKGKSNG